MTATCYLMAGMKTKNVYNLDIIITSRILTLVLGSMI